MTPERKPSNYIDPAVTRWAQAMPDAELEAAMAELEKREVPMSDCRCDERWPLVVAMCEKLRAARREVACRLGMPAHQKMVRISAARAEMTSMTPAERRAFLSRAATKAEQTENV